MKNLLFYVVLLSFLIPFVSSFSPADHYLISCGSHEASVIDFDHRRFIGDASDSGSGFLTSLGATIPITDPSNSPLYRTARAFRRPSKYVFQIKDQGVHHLVRLHFCRFNSTFFGNSDAQFHVVANGYLLLHNFNMSKFQEGSVIKEFILKIDGDKLEIAFVPVKRSDFAYVNAIEVISAPKDLVSDLAAFVDSEKTFKIDGLLKNGFETVYRVTVGGPKVTPFNDSLWRNWIPDDQYLSTLEGSSRVHFSGRISYQSGGASREVGPDNVYSSARVIKSLDDSIPRSNITWTFSGIEHKYTYLVRLHFCDIASIAPNMLYFNVYLNGNLAYENLDLSAQTNGLLASPFYADCVVDGGVSGILAISVGASNMSLPHAADAILNGVEVFKLNNQMGSFDGEVCAGSVMKTWRRENTGVFFVLLAVLLLLLAASVAFQRRRTGTKEALGFSRLPVDVSEVEVNYGNQVSSVKL